MSFGARCFSVSPGREPPALCGARDPHPHTCVEGGGPRFRDSGVLLPFSFASCWCPTLFVFFSDFGWGACVSGSNTDTQAERRMCVLVWVHACVYAFSPPFFPVCVRL